MGEDPMLYQRSSDTEGPAWKRWFGDWRFLVACLMVIVSVTTTYTTIKSTESKVLSHDNNIQTIQQSLTNLTTTVTVLEERTRSQESDIQEIKGYLRQILRKVE